jgi:catechol 2,3-dioxygenase-like lactoylglutathione lyase family enzyme
MLGGLAHVALGAGEHLERTVQFYEELLGVTEVHRHESTVFLSSGRSSSYDLAIGPEPAGMDHFAFEVVDLETLGALRTGLLAAGVEVEDVDPEHDHGIAEGCALVLPSGHRMELVLPERPHVFRGTPTVDSRNAKGAGPVALEHLTIDCPDVEAVGRFLIDRLGFRATEVSAPPSGGWFLAFMRTRDLHHDLGLFSNWAFDGPGFNHVGFTVAGAGELVRAADGAYRLGHALHYPIGRHLVGDNVFVYLLDPAGNRVEVGTPLTGVEIAAPTRWFDASADSEWRGFDAWNAGPIPEDVRRAGPCVDARISV